MFPSFISLFLPYSHVFIVFFCHCNHATARCSQDGIIGENVCTAYFSQGLSLANYCLDGSQRFSPITCIFPVHAWTPAKAQFALSVWCCLWQWYYRCPEKWPIVAHGSPYYKILASKLHGGDTTCPASFLSTQKKSELLALLGF